MVKPWVGLQFREELLAAAAADTTAFQSDSQCPQFRVKECPANELRLGLACVLGYAACRISRSKR